MYKILISVILTFCLFPKCNIKPKSKMAIQYPVSYFDQNNNKYLISETEVIYEPVSLSQSSSGQYYGGTSFLKSLDPHTKKNLEKILIELISDESYHATNREKLTALLKTGISIHFLKPCKHRKNLENLLKGHE